MNWQSILKQPKLRTGSKVTTNLGIDSEKDENTPCKRKIQEYMDKANSIDQDGYHRVGTSTSTIVPDWPEEVYCMALKKLNELSFEKLEIETMPNGGKVYHQPVHQELNDYVVNCYYGGEEDTVRGGHDHSYGYVYMTLNIQQLIPHEEIMIRNFKIIYKDDMEAALKEVDWR